MRKYDNIYLSIAELKMIRDAVRNSIYQAADTEAARPIRQLVHKLDALKEPQFGAQIISDPSTYSEES